MSDPMSIKQQLQVKQTHFLSQQQRESMEILCMPVMELNQYLQIQIAENVLLEFSALEKGEEDERLNKEVKALISNEENYQESFNYPSTGEETDPLEVYADNGPDLYDYLRSQLCFWGLNHEEEEICLYIINNLNSYGYLEISLADICRDFACPKEQAQAMLNIIHRLDPPGIGGENLVECLLLQLDYRNQAAPLAGEIIKNYLQDLALNRISLINKKTGAALEEIISAKQLITALNPYPGLAYAKREATGYCYPDITIRIVDDKPLILINDSPYSSLQFNDYYLRMLKDKEALDQATYNYLKERFNAAKYLMKAISQRKQTLAKIAESIFYLQADYFLGKSEYLFPMTLKDVAELAEVHESTVSRATRGKYLLYGRGLLEIKKLFGQAVSGNAGRTPKEIKESLKAIIKEEDPRKPLSDQKIRQLLAEQKIYLARRTVAKYREELGIYSTAKRKRY